MSDPQDRRQVQQFAEPPGTGLVRSGEAGDLRMSCARSLDEAVALRPVWERLQRHPNIDIDHFAMIVRLRPEVERPHVLLIERDGEAPLMVVGRIERRPLSLCLGYKVFNGPRTRLLEVPYGGIFGEASPEAVASALRHFVGMLEDGEIDLVNFNYLSVGSPFHSLVDAIPRGVCRRRAGPAKLHHRLSLSGDYEGYRRRCPKSLRKNLRRYGRRMTRDWEGRIEFRCYRMPAELETVMRDAETIARKTYQRGLGVGFKSDEETRRRLLLQLERGWLRAYFLYLGGRPAAFSFIARYGEVAYAGETGYDPQFAEYRIGHSLNDHVIEELCADGSLVALDYGFGDAEYKRAICDQVWSERNVTLFSTTRRGLARYALEGAFATTELFGRKLMNGSRLLPFIKRAWRRGVFVRREG